VVVEAEAEALNLLVVVVDVLQPHSEGAFVEYWVYQHSDLVLKVFLVSLYL
jgi:hypothetical protein